MFRGNFERVLLEWLSASCSRATAGCTEVPTDTWHRMSRTPWIQSRAFALWRKPARSRRGGVQALLYVPSPLINSPTCLSRRQIFLFLPWLRLHSLIWLPFRED